MGIFPCVSALHDPHQLTYTDLKADYTRTEIEQSTLSVGTSGNLFPDPVRLRSFVAQSNSSYIVIPKVFSLMEHHNPESFKVSKRIIWIFCLGSTVTGQLGSVTTLKDAPATALKVTLF